MSTSRKTIPYGVTGDTSPPRSSSRRRSSAPKDPKDRKLPLHVSPLPERVDVTDREDAQDVNAPVSSTAVTQPMPVVTPPLGSQRPAIPPPPDSNPETERASRRAKLETPGVYRFTSPESERRKKR